MSIAAKAPAKPVRKPGRLERAARRKALAAVKPAMPYAACIAAAVLAAAVLHRPGLAWAALGAAAMHAGLRLHEAYGWHRGGGKAAMRRRRRYQGTATARELRQHLSARAARRRAPVTCPGLASSQAPVVIAAAGRPPRPVAGTREDSYLLVSPPRTGKTGLLGCWAADAPGALLATSTRTDLYAHTVIPRSRLGDVHVLNPGGDGGIPSTLAWSPLEGCEDPGIAIERAGYLMAAAPKDAGGKDAWWDAKGAELLRLMLHAAALAGATMAQAAAWVRDPCSPEPSSILAACGAPGWAHALAALTAADSEQLHGIAASASAALSWMDDPAMAAAACPPPGEGFDIGRFVTEGAGTVYLVGADRPHGSLAPYFAAFAAAVFETAKWAASVSEGGRLPVPLTLALDEAAITCPVPLHKWMSEAGGHGVTIMAAVQALSQLAARWGEHDGKTIFTNATVKVVFGGHTDAADLEAMSAVCGMRDTWDHVKAPDGGRTRQPRQERAVPAERIRMLTRGEALILHRSTRPVIGRVTPVWDRPGYERAAPGEAFPARVPEAQPAIGERREPIALPAAPPAPPALDSPASVPVPEEEVPQWLHASNPASASTRG